MSVSDHNQSELQSGRDATSTLLPMLIGGLVLIVIGMIVVAIFA